MKTKLPNSINTIEEAKIFLHELHSNGEAYHPEDSAHDISNGIVDGCMFSRDEADDLDVLMDQIYLLPGNDGRHCGPMAFDPCQYLNDLMGHVME